MKLLHEAAFSLLFLQSYSASFPLPEQYDTQRDRNSQGGCHDCVKNIMTDTHPVQSEFNSAAQRNHNRKRDNRGKKNSFLRFSVPDPGKDHSPDQKDGRHDLLEADKAVLKVVVIPETFQDDSPGTAQKHEQDPQIPVLSSFPRQEKHENKKQDNTINYPSFNSTKIDISDISVSLNKDNEKAKKKAKSEERLQNLKNTQHANRGNKKAGTKITTDKAEAKESLVHVEKASNEIDQLRKDLQATERDFTKAENSGKVKVDPEIRKTLEKKRAIAANAVSKQSQKLKAPSMGIIASLKTLAENAVSNVRKSIKSR